jgi:hypothetical protein
LGDGYESHRGVGTVSFPERDCHEGRSVVVCEKDVGMSNCIHLFMLREIAIAWRYLINVFEDGL